MGGPEPAALYRTPALLEHLAPSHELSPADGWAHTSEASETSRLRDSLGPILLPVESKKQVDFPEPRVRINTDPADADAPGWDESAAWDEMARCYRDLIEPHAG
jgi:hypothetical protein